MQVYLDKTPILNANVSLVFKGRPYFSLILNLMQRLNLHLNATETDEFSKNVSSVVSSRGTKLAIETTDVFVPL